MPKPSLLLAIHLPDGQATLERLLEEGPAVVGRSSRAGLKISDPILSREHARLVQDAEGWLAEDLGSHNGTYINGRRIAAPARLSPGDALTLGGTRIDVLRVGDRSPSDDMKGALFQSAISYLDRNRSSSDTADHDTLRRRVERLRIALDVHQALSRPITLDRLLDLILDRIFAHLEPDEVAIYLLKPDGTAACAASRSLRGDDRAPFYSAHLLDQVARKGLAAYVPDVGSDARFAEASSILDAGVRAVLAAPLMDGEGCLGMVVAGAGGRRPYGDDDLELLVSLAAAATLRIRNVALNEEALERRRLSDEMSLARNIQQSLLPERLPEVEGWELYAVNQPSNVVSGDFYSARLQSDPARLALMIADVAGKGVTASLLTASLEALCADPMEAGLEPHEVFTRVSAQLLQRTPPARFATAFLGLVDPHSGRMSFANAGHLPALVVNLDGLHRWLRAHGLPLGLMASAEYEPGEELLEPGDLLVLLTDGFTEAFDAREEEFGQERLAQVCLERAAEPLEEIWRGIEEAVKRFTASAPPSDDRTLILLRRLT